MELKNKKLSLDEFMNERLQVLQTWPTGKEVENFAEAVNYQQSIPEHKRFSLALLKADQQGKTLSQPRAGVALIDEHIELLKTLEQECDLLPTTIDAYTRLNRYEEAAVGIQKSLEAGTSKLNGLPVVNHGVAACRRLTETLEKPLQIRHGTPDARLLAEISFASGFTSYEGGGISYNIPYAKRVTLEKSIRDWQYCDRLVGLYEEHGIRMNREPFGPLTGTLIPPFMSHSVAIIEGLLALEQGVKSITVGYGQVGSLIQDIAAIKSLRELSHEYFHNYGYEDYELSTVFHQWMGGFPEDEAKAFAIISWGAAVAGMSGATKVITKSPHEAFGIPTAAANAQGLKASRQMLNMVSEQKFPPCPAVDQEVELIKSEVRAVLKKVFELGNGDIARGTVLAFEAGVLDIPFAPSVCNAGKILPVRDNTGAIRLLEAGCVPLPQDILALHHDYVAERARAEGRGPSFQMVIDDINAVSHSQLIGRP
ncbi:methylaspartate mutase subunit E [Escherichia fergusonii]|uniref:methylaspartate mutase subunit E n=1 Tax=Escherichia fergusonii TaxID=564 RepID=UPI00061464F9|nr:methylaspartate mutase subunit E [Escherichia fergusonii]EFL4496359.1 methylaspartate mutase subunit E [Escherichia fergusonii]EHG6157880.1 methylaspartate mutase subunit E [Escherichia fergusonii]EHJ4139946.1 methylaspartate mutase subunit E [Escherichia fergusonii]EHK3064360.1 methylaspartate mutase subunit E [Escherichia fergusonii]EHK3072279.1 methylaspartate mutase subunit E [Escherichia fergusonii]